MMETYRQELEQQRLEMEQQSLELEQLRLEIDTRRQEELAQWNEDVQNLQASQDRELVALKRLRERDREVKELRQRLESLTEGTSTKSTQLSGAALPPRSPSALEARCTHGFRVLIGSRSSFR